MKKWNIKILLPVAGVVLLVVSVLAFRDVKAGMGVGIASLVVFGAGVQEMRGKLGNTVFVTTKVGTYTKVRKKGANPQSPAQQLNRQQHALLMRLWSSPEVDRKAFNRYAASNLVPNRMGKLIQISGINWFVKFNRLALRANPDCALIIRPPLKAIEFPVVELKVSASLTPESVIVDVGHVQDYEAGMRLEIFATMPISAGVSNGGKLYRSIGVYEPNSYQQTVVSSHLPITGNLNTTIIKQLPANRIDITGDYLAKLWTLKMGMQILVKARMIMPTGQTSMYVTGSAIIH